MCIFLLKTLCKDRGYAETVKIDSNPENGVVVLRPEEIISIYGKKKKKHQGGKVKAAKKQG